MENQDTIRLDFKESITNQIIDFRNGRYQGCADIYNR